MNMFQGDTAALAALANEVQSQRLLRLDFPRQDGPAGALMLANTLEADEALSCDFTYVVEVLSDQDGIALTAVMGKMVTVSLVREDGTLRYFNGYVFEFRFVKTDGGFAHYKMVLKPWLAFLRLREDSVAFHDLSVTEICEQTFTDYLQRDYKVRMTGDDPAMTLAVQRNESDHNHLHRRLEAAGLHYWYEHRFDGHTLWLSDDSSTGEPIDGAVPEMRYQRCGGAAEDDGLDQWSAMRRIGAGQVTLSSYDFKNGRAQRAERPSRHHQGAVPAFEVFHDTGAYGFRHGHHGQQLAALRMEALDARAQQFTAEGNARHAQSGRWFRLAGQVSDAARPSGQCTAADAATQRYLIVALRHRASNNYQHGHAAVSHYTNQFSCVRRELPWRPPCGFHSVAQPIYGTQTATVVGPPGEEIYTDKYGRVRVQFHWDRAGAFDEKSSPWVRVMSSWAGANFGQISLPRVGQEVVIQFIDGNGDRPLVIGAVYNASNMPPWDLPANKTQSGILTRSSTGARASQANALRFEDRRGAEELWLHAEREQRIEVEHDELHWVGNDRVQRVGHDETRETGHDRRVHIGGDEHLKVDGGIHEQVRMEKTESVGLAKALSVGGAYQVSVGAAMNTSVGLSQSEQVGLNKLSSVTKGYEIDAGQHFSVDVGSASLRLNADGSIVLRGTRILFEASGPIDIHGNDVDIANGGAADPHKQQAPPTGQPAAAATGTATSRTVPAAATPGDMRATLNAADAPFRATPAITRKDDLSMIWTPADAPATLVLDRTVQNDSEALWRSSHVDGKAREFGGTLTADGDGVISTTNMGTSGKSDAFHPDLNVADDQRVMGIVHTHPYDVQNGTSYQNVSLSGADAAYLANSDHRMIMAQSGDGQFAFVKTGQTLDKVDALKLQDEGNAMVRQLMDEKGMSFEGASQQAARKMAQDLNMAYYEGKNGVLTRVVP